MGITSKNNHRVLCIGEAMLELSFSQPDNQINTEIDNQNESATVRYAGDTLNTAIYLQRLSNSDTTVSYCTAVGRDALSTRLVDFIKSENIDVSAIQTVDDRTIGLYAISTDANGERSFTYWRNESAAKTLFQQNNTTDFSALEDFDVIYLSAITVAILPATIRKALLDKLSFLRQDKNTLIAFDSNYRPALWESQSIARSTISSFWEITDIALPSIDDEQALFQDSDEQELLSRFKSYGIIQGALKRGDIGPLGLSEKASSLDASSLPVVNVVDTTAAGDSFNAGYLSAILNGATEIGALTAGHQCAARVISCRGAIIPAYQW